MLICTEFCISSLNSQEYVYQGFKNTNDINVHTYSITVVLTSEVFHK